MNDRLKGFPSHNHVDEFAAMMMMMIIIAVARPSYYLHSPVPIFTLIHAPQLENKPLYTSRAVSYFNETEF